MFDLDRIAVRSADSVLIALAVFFRRCAFEQENEQRVGIFADGDALARHRRRFVNALDGAPPRFVFEQLHDGFAGLFELRLVFRVTIKPLVVIPAMQTDHLEGFIYPADFLVAHQHGHFGGLQVAQLFRTCDYATHCTHTPPE